MNSKRTMVALALITAGNFMVSPAATAFEAADVTGSWTTEAKKLAISAVMYTTLLKDGSCTQVLKISGMGMTKWAVDRCAWSVQASKLSIRITSSPTLPDKVGETSVTTIRAVTPDTMKIENEKKQTQDWTRVAAWPAEFSKQFDDAYAAATTKPD